MSLLWITKVEYVDNYRLNLQFNTSEKGVVNLENHLDKRIFEPLKEVDFFKKVKLNSWTIEWENGADFSPEFLKEILILS
ncbi:DUF2442 domain-containing protein [Flavobacterium sp.]|jgi:hypothetical protein|uniref:DUF2442 domain-containing protein n=1 Tax=Flavobacterium sp. TaxID=239 RepID=UPI0037BF2C3C